MNPTEIIPPVNVLLVDDHIIWRGGVRSMLDDTEFKIVGEAGSGQEAVAEARHLREIGTVLRLALLDIRMAGGDGLEALVALKAEHPQLAAIMLTNYDNPSYLARAVAGGAAGYLLKGIGREELLKALRMVASGDSLLSREELSRTLNGVSAETLAGEDLNNPLSVRELEVLRLLATGATNKDMAPLLYISESTVKTHVEHIIRKLGVSDRVQAAVWAARRGLFSESA